MFVVKRRDLIEGKCVPLLVLYCCDILEHKYMSAMHPDVAVRRPLLNL